MANTDYSEAFIRDAVDKQFTISYNGGVLTNENICDESMTLKEILCGDKQLRFGSCNASCFELTIINNVSSLKNEVLTVACKVEGMEDTPYQFGMYKVDSDKPTADRRYRDIVAYDAMHDILVADVAVWYNTILPDTDSTVTMKEFRDSFFSYFGIEQEEVSLVNDDMVVTKTIEPSQLSGKTVITAICEINGCFGHIGRNGKFQYVYLPDSMLGVIANAEEISSSIYINAEYEDFSTEKINKLQIRQEENDIGCIYGTGDNCYIVQDNFLVYGKSSSELEIIAQNLYSVISTVQYNPAHVEAKGNPCLEVGDGVYFTANGKTIYTYILQRTLKGIQALRDTYDADGEQYQSEKLNSVHDDIIELKGKENILKRTIEETKSTIKDVESGLQTKITQNASSISAEITRATGAETGLSNRISATESKFSVKIEEIQKEIDGEIVTYNVSYVPTLLNYPAWDFTYNIPCDNTVACTDIPMIYNDEYYSRNARSVVFNEVTSMSYRFTKGENEEWYWRDIGDTDFGIAMQKISELEITTDSISATVEQNQIYNNQQISSLSSGITQTAESISSEVKRATEAEGALSSKITQTADSISSEVTRATYAESNLSSKINQTADQIELKVSKGDVSSQLSIESGQVTLKSNRFVLESTNCSISANGTIKASNVDLSGKITASSGKIGGFTIGSNGLTSGSTGSLSNPFGVYIGKDGISCGTSGAAFKVTNVGVLTIDSASGSIALGNTSSGRMVLDKDGISFGASTNTTEITKDKIKIYNTYIEKNTVHCAKYSSASTYYTDINGDEIELHGSSTSSFLKIKSGETIWASYSGTYNIKGDSGDILIALSRNRVEVIPDNVVIGKGFSASTVGFFGSNGSSKKSITAISSTSSATASSNATKINEILTALKAYNLIG